MLKSVCVCGEVCVYIVNVCAVVVVFGGGGVVVVVGGSTRLKGVLFPSGVECKE